jgi:hypothetical protein
MTRQQDAHQPGSPLTGHCRLLCEEDQDLLSALVR